MKNTQRTRSRQPEADEPETHCELTELLSNLVIGQPTAIESIVPFVLMHEAGLAPEGRPVGVFLLLGPTGTGKTRTVEALAEALHSSSRKLLRIDCGEFQMEHEVAKLIGAPPGYLGHRETQPLLSQQKVNTVSSEYSDLSIVLFDEIEKAAPSLNRLLLGILDKASLRLGDNSTVNFENTLIFMTSNLGAQNMNRELRPDFGFEAMVPREGGDARKLETIAMNAVRKRFSPEFINRLDAVITYQPLAAETLAVILDQHLDALQDHIEERLADRAFRLEVPARTRKHLLKKGCSPEYGARELKRTLQRELIQPLAAMVAGGHVEPGSVVRADLNDARDRISLRAA